MAATDGLKWLIDYNLHIHCVQKKNTHSHFLSYLHELFVDLNKNCSEYTQGKVDSDSLVTALFLILAFTRATLC